MRKLYFSFIAFLILFSTVNFAQIVAPVTFRLDLNDVIGSVPNSDSAAYESLQESLRKKLQDRLK